MLITNLKEKNMKVKRYDEIEPELVGIGKTTNQSASLRKEAILETNGRTKKEEKRIATAIREKKNTSKGKSPRVTPQSLEKKKNELNNRKKRREFLNNEGRSL